MEKTSTLLPLGRSDDHESAVKSWTEVLTEKLGLREELPTDFDESESGAKGDVESE
jgi:hypothetical protein